jgi:anti-anti-sigma factor
MDFGNDIEIRVEETDGPRVMYVAGEFCLSSAEKLREALIEALEPGRVTVLDMGGVTAIDLSGLQLLCSAHRTYARSQSGLELRAMPERLWRTACAAGFDAEMAACPFRQDEVCLWKKR